jgi:hypothetical protein
MKHRSFSIEVAKLPLCKFDEELENHGYKTTVRKVLSDDVTYYRTPTEDSSDSYTRLTKTNRIMLSDKGYLAFQTDETIQVEDGNTLNIVSIQGTLSVCDDKELEEFKQIVKAAFNIENLELNEMSSK